MRDVRDWNKYVDMLGKAVTRRAVPEGAPVPPGVNRPQDAQDESAPPQNVCQGDARPLPPRKGRGPRRPETREELLSRLLDPTLTLEETARLLEVCPTTVRRYTNKGILPCERSAGNQRRFKLSHVLAFEAQPHEAGGNSPGDGA